MSERCWCGETHPEKPADFHEACVALGHVILAKSKIPELTEWLSRWLSRNAWW